MVDVTLQNKNSLSVTNQDKTGSTVTWNESVESWDEAGGTWDNPGTPASLQTKNTLIVSNENKN